MTLLIEQIYFAICALMAIVGAVGTIALRNPIRCAMSLLFTIIAIAGMYLQLHAPFLAAIQLIVYAGAVVILFVFVIMLIGPASAPTHDSRALVSRISGGVAGSAVGLMIVTTLAHKVFGAQPAIASGFGSIDSFGGLLFSDYLVPFEITSFLLMVAIVGAVAVARGKQPDPQGKKTIALATDPNLPAPALETVKKGAHA